MPEKPEVMTVAKSIFSLICNKTITDCYVYWDNIIAYPTSEEFRKKIIGEKIKNVTTRGKFIVIELTKLFLLVHLRMEGKFMFREKGIPLNKHEHVEFILDDEVSFRFHDVRKFGKMYLFSKDEVYNKPPLSLLGKEFYSDDLTKEYLYDKLSKMRTPIKTALLDQTIIAGIGNIYDDEILFLSGISPMRKANDVTIDECQLIIDNTKKVLSEAVKLGGTTIKSFTSSEGVHGLFQNKLLVHSQEGKLCPNCKSKIIKIKLGGRGTYYCPFCQK